MALISPDQIIVAAKKTAVPIFMAKPKCPLDLRTQISTDFHRLNFQIFHVRLAAEEAMQQSLRE